METLYIGRRDDNQAAIEDTEEEIKVCAFVDEIMENIGYVHHHWE